MTDKGLNSFGDPGLWQLIGRVVTDDSVESTMALEIPGGVLVRVSAQYSFDASMLASGKKLQGKSLAESMKFIPGHRIKTWLGLDGKPIQRELVASRYQETDDDGAVAYIDMVEDLPPELLPSLTEEYQAKQEAEAADREDTLEQIKTVLAEVEETRESVQAGRKQLEDKRVEADEAAKSVLKDRDEAATALDQTREARTAAATDRDSASKELKKAHRVAENELALARIEAEKIKVAAAHVMNDATRHQNAALQLQKTARSEALEIKKLAAKDLDEARKIRGETEKEQAEADAEKLTEDPKE